MTDNGNGKLNRALNIVLVGLVVILIGGMTYNAKTNAATCERVARLEAQYETIREDLRDIKRALGVVERSRL